MWVGLSDYKLGGLVFFFCLGRPLPNPETEDNIIEQCAFHFPYLPNTNDILYTSTEFEYKNQVLIIYEKMSKKILCNVQTFVITQTLLCTQSIALYLICKLLRQTKSLVPVNHLLVTT